MADFGIGETAAVEAAWEEAAALAAAEAAAAAGTTAAGGAAASGLTAAELAAMASASSVGGGSELGSLGADAALGSGGLLGSGASEFAPAGAQAVGNWASEFGPQASQNGLLGSGSSLPYGAGDTVTNGIASQPGQGPGMYEDLKYKAINALNETGGQYNKLPGPVQGMIASQAMKGLFGTGQQPHPVSAQMPQHAMAPMAPIAPTYQQQPYQAQSFGSSYGGGMGGQQMTPQLLALLQKLRLQQGM